MNIRSLLIISLLINTAAFSQQNFIEGNIKTISGESIKGYINYKNWKKNPAEIYFRQAINSEIEIFSPSNIISFNVSNDNYVSKNVSIDLTSRSIQSAKSYFYDNNEIKKVFLKLIFNSEKSLYSFTSKNGKKHFYINNNGKFEELIYKVAVVGSKKMERKEFIAQLSNYLNNCNNLKISNIAFSKTNFIKLFKQHNKCISGSIKYIENEEKSLFKSYLISGLSNSFIEFSTESVSSGRRVSENGTSSNFAYGGAFEVIFSRSRKKKSIYNEILFYSYDFNFTDVNVINPNHKVTSKYDMSLAYIKISNAYRYNFSSAKNTAFINIGLVNSIMVKKDLNRSIRTEFFIDDHFRSENLPTHDHYDIGVLIGVGVKINKFSLEARFESSKQFQFTNSINLKNQKLFLLASFNLF